MWVQPNAGGNCSCRTDGSRTSIESASYCCPRALIESDFPCTPEAMVRRRCFCYTEVLVRGLLPELGAAGTGTFNIEQYRGIGLSPGRY
jgi:hypothetical protein